MSVGIGCSSAEKQREADALDEKLNTTMGDYKHCLDDNTPKYARAQGSVSDIADAIESACGAKYDEFEATSIKTLQAKTSDSYATRAFLIGKAGAEDIRSDFRKYIKQSVLEFRSK